MKIEMDYDTLLKLSEVIIKAIENNNKAAHEVSSYSIVKSIDEENKKLQELNSLLCDYATKIGKE